MTAREIVTAVRESGGWFEVVNERLVVRCRRPLPPHLVAQIAAFEDEIKPLVRRPADRTTPTMTLAPCAAPRAARGALCAPRIPTDIRQGR